ncbi:cell division protein ZapB [Archangium violaceum]|uniref:cell division protein ZapB n=1 Tax=Archangium violaceum TaxID=83451 RepID=UPI00193B390F|nr:cell division protein ZapB [Archangium violaceum]QRK06750.1 cell division protein ZapB [Archangium violaceum]
MVQVDARDVQIAQLEKRLEAALERIAQLEEENAKLREENAKLREENRQLEERLVLAFTRKRGNLDREAGGVPGVRPPGPR